MSLIFATQLTAVATAALGAFAIITAVLAGLAFRKQSQEVRAIERQVKDQEELTQQQAHLLKVQSDQLELQRQQLDDQREANARQAEVFELQASELRESLDERKREADVRHREQARHISAVLGPLERPANPEPGARSVLHGRTAVDLINSSPEPVYNLVIAIVGIQGTLPRTIEGWLEMRDRYRSEQGTPEPIPVTTASILSSGTYRVWIRGTGWWGVLSGRGAAEIGFTDRDGCHWIRRASGQLEELSEDPIHYYLKHGPHELQTPERLP